MKLTDFLGREYGPDDLVIYAAMGGRCPNMVIGRVVEIHRVYRDPDSYKWARLEEGQVVPRKTNWKDEDIGECETELRVLVQPLRSARWEQHHAKSYYIDSRSGRRIDPGRSKKYVAVPSHFESTEGVTYDYDGEKLAWEQGEGRYSRNTFDGHFRRTYHINYGEVGSFRFPLTEDVALKPQLWYVSDRYHDWVQEVKAELPKPVTLIITENIVKWEGELPDVVPVQVP